MRTQNIVVLKYIYIYVLFYPDLSYCVPVVQLMETFKSVWHSNIIIIFSILLLQVSQFSMN